MKSSKQAKVPEPKVSEPTSEAIFADLRNTNTEMGIIIGKQLARIQAQAALLDCYRAIVTDLSISKSQSRKE